MVKIRDISPDIRKVYQTFTAWKNLPKINVIKRRKDFAEWLSETLKETTHYSEAVRHIYADEGMLGKLFDRVCSESKVEGDIFKSTIDSDNRVRDAKYVEKWINLPEQGDETTELFSKFTSSQDDQVSTGYRRIVYGDHGPYFEFTKEQLHFKSFPANMNKVKCDLEPDTCAASSVASKRCEAASPTAVRRT